MSFQAELPMAFRAARYRFDLAGEQAERGRPLSGPMLRGVFGKTLRGCVCVCPKLTCDACPVRAQCAYVYLVDTAPSESAGDTRETDVPRPYAFEPAGTPSRFGLMLAGRAIDFFPYFVFALTEMGRHGLGRDRVTYNVNEVRCDGNGQGDHLLMGPDGCLHDYAAALTGEDFHRRAEQLPSYQLTLRFQTPVQLRADKRLLTSPAALTFAVLFGSLLERVRSLCVHHCRTPLEVDYKVLRAAAHEVQVTDNRLHFANNSRHSTRQGRDLNLGGFLGEVTFRGDLTPFLPILCAGEVVHVGRHCVYGLGRYEIVSAETDQTPKGGEMP